MQMDNGTAPNNQISYYQTPFKSGSLTKPPHSALPTQCLIWILTEVNCKNPRQTKPYTYLSLMMLPTSKKKEKQMNNYQHR